MKPLFPLPFLLALGLLSCQALAAEPAALSAGVSSMLPLCASCHGIDGISSNGLYPNLAGQKSDYLVKQLNAFKHRERTDPTMNPLAEPLDAATIRELANYFASRPMAR